MREEQVEETARAPHSSDEPHPDGPYSHLDREELVALLERRDRERARIGLNWAADKAERDRALNDQFVTLRLVPELCDRAGPWHNLIIEGENFDALRWLRMTMRGRVKCIYADPPYNTGNRDWVYNDSYRDPSDPFFQTAWLEFLHRRFALARDLLSEDGVLLVSINDDNRAILELMLDQTLPGMKVGSLVWRTRQGSNADQRAFLSPDHEHVLVYAGPRFRFGGLSKSYAMYKYRDENRRDNYRLSDLTLGFNYQERPNLFYPLLDPKTGIYFPANPNRVWVYPTRERVRPGQRIQTRTMEEWIVADHIHFPAEQRVETWRTLSDLRSAIGKGDVPRSGNALKLWEGMPGIEDWVGRPVGFGTPSFKRFRADLRNATQPLSSWILSRAEIDGEDSDRVSKPITSGTNEEGTRALISLFGQKVFNYPKPVSLIRELVRQSTGPDDLVLDFTAGSGTTAQAVMELNAEDGGARRFILVSHDEKTTDDPGRNIARDVTCERVRRLNKRATESDTGVPAPFAYLRTHQIPTERLMDERHGLTPEDVWLAVQAGHGLPLWRYDETAALQAHETDDLAVVFCDVVSEDALAALLAIAMGRKGIHAYAWTPGPIRRALEDRDAEFHRLPDALWQRFKS